jgi:hypothetical protein
MVKANELRIGNWVKFLLDGTYHQVKFIDFVNWDENEANQLEYIPISDEILKKCGFKEKNQYSSYFSINKFEFYIERDILHYDLFGGKSVKLKHLHQLQNLYFALTGQELTVNL